MDEIKNTLKNVKNSAKEKIKENEQLKEIDKLFKTCKWKQKQ